MLVTEDKYKIYFKFVNYLMIFTECVHNFREENTNEAEKEDRRRQIENLQGAIEHFNAKKLTTENFMQQLQHTSKKMKDDLQNIRYEETSLKQQKRNTNTQLTLIIKKLFNHNSFPFRMCHIKKRTWVTGQVLMSRELNNHS